MTPLTLGEPATFPGRGSQPLSERLQAHRSVYPAMSRMRLAVAGDQPWVARMRPITASASSRFTMARSEHPSAYALKSVDHDGHRYYFCSQGCMDDFEADPTEYLQQSSNA